MADKANPPSSQLGIYNIDYFSGAQVAIYIGDILVDEVTSISYSVQQSKRPLYGYADTLFREVSRGQVLVQGQFTINFKEAGYLWLVLDRYQQLHNPISASNREKGNLWETTTRRTIEQIVGAEDLPPLPELNEEQNKSAALAQRYRLLTDLSAQDALTGFPGGGRSSVQDPYSLGKAENIFEAFEDAVWNGSLIGTENGNSVGKDFNRAADRRCDNPNLNGFDIYVAFGDYAGQNKFNHTMQKLENVHILGTSKEIQPDGLPISEQYQFIARNII